MTRLERSGPVEEAAVEEAAVAAEASASGRGRPRSRGPAAGATTARNALEALEAVAYLNEQTGSPATLATIVTQSRRNVSSVYRYVQVLLAKGYLKQVDGGYVLGSAILNLAGVALASLDVRREAQPMLQELARKTGETVHLVMPDGLDVVYVDKVEGRHSVLVRSRIGARAPFSTTAVGKAIAAFSDKAFQVEVSQHLVRHTARSETDPVRWLHELDEITRKGFALDLGENEDGIHCVAAPIRDHVGKVIAAISVSGPAGRMTREYLERFAPHVSAAAHEVASRLGYRARTSPLGVDAGT